ncbi:Uma2 family endonuclease [Synechocystis salina]|uniref:Uma2 family endonuclease n=1 Tax=Synechocystis salina LEGE 00031 TaxID=1828736 RepID=A0ABR9VUF5_9SYNC|nr:Uma2 family endonuclease [Synechocystis salina]MBE9241698.1 Uma2 family endonuclease [Synechocystis salina LEGE 00041]MBE9254998.1 Uma2 family endonuclease [Synechocystis salina LEGE 00031]
MLAKETFTPLPDHTQLPCEDGTFVKNFQEHPQSILLTSAIRPVLDQIHTDGQYTIGQDSGIYWRLTEPPQRVAEAPDWFYVPNVPPLLNGKGRRSYVLWQEIIPPQIVLEFVSGDGFEERDRTPWTGKFWIYETVIRPAYYGIYEVEKASVELYYLIGSHYELMNPNAYGHYEIPELQVALGIWQGTYQNMELPWLRWWDLQGKLLPNPEEKVIQAEEKAEKLAAKLRELGINPETLD